MSLVGGGGSHANAENPLARQKTPIPAHFWLGGPNLALGAQMVFHVISHDRSLGCFCLKCVPFCGGEVQEVVGLLCSCPPILLAQHFPSQPALEGDTPPPICGAGWCSPLPELVSWGGRVAAWSWVHEEPLGVESGGLGRDRTPTTGDRSLTRGGFVGRGAFWSSTAPPTSPRNSPRGNQGGHRWVLGSSPHPCQAPWDCACRGEAAGCGGG